MLAFLLAATTAVPALIAADTKAQLSFGVSMARRGLWQEALFRFQQAAAQGGSNARVHNNMAVAYEALGRFEEAEKSYQEAVRMDGGNRVLKQNYTRFIEFYRAYQGSGAETAEAEGVKSEASEAATSAEGP